MDTIQNIIYQEPTCKCLVCDTREDPQATLVDHSRTWLCPECKSILLEIITSRKVKERISEGGMIPHHD